MERWGAQRFRKRSQSAPLGGGLWLRLGPGEALRAEAGRKPKSIKEKLIKRRKRKEEAQRGSAAAPESPKRRAPAAWSTREVAYLKRTGAPPLQARSNDEYLQLVTFGCVLFVVSVLTAWRKSFSGWSRSSGMPAPGTCRVEARMAAEAAARRSDSE